MLMTLSLSIVAQGYRIFYLFPHCFCKQRPGLPAGKKVAFKETKDKVKFSKMHYLSQVQ